MDPKIPHNGPLALIVEDDAATRKLLAVWLRELGLEIIGVKDGQRALDVLEEHQPTLILLDLMMQPLGGYAFLKHYEGSAPIVVITAEEASDQLIKLQDAGARAILKKPITQARVHATVRRLLDKDRK